MAAAFALAALALHVATSGRYGYFRDELYFIACAKHLAWGYVDQPPLVAVAAWLSGPFGYALPALRLLAALSAALTVWLAAKIAGELGGGGFARALAATATMLLPAYLLLGNTLTTTSFEPFAWTLVVYLLLRMTRREDPRLWPAVGLAVAFGLYGKYSMLLLVAALACGLALVPERRSFATWWFPASALLCAVLLWPNALWQAEHGWPFAAVVRGDFAHRHAFENGLALEYRNALRNALAFLLEQIVYTGPAAAVLWIAGLAAAFTPYLRRARFVALAYAVLVVLAIAFEAKGYYIAGIYAALVAAGSVAIERAVRRRFARGALLASFLAIALPLVPFSIPVLPVDALVRYTQWLHLTAQNGTPPHLVQPVFAEEFGWNGLTRRVAQVYDALPPRTRARTGLFADTYGDAGALALYGPRYGLPPPISAQNTYYLWGTHGYDGDPIIVVGATQSALVHRLFRHVTLAATYANPYKWVVEGPTPIYLCSDPVAPFERLWPRFKWFGA